MTINELEYEKEKPLEIPPHSVLLNTEHSVEKVVQEVSKASYEVSGYPRRDGYVRTSVNHRENSPVFKSKKDIMNFMMNIELQSCRKNIQ